MKSLKKFAIFLFSVLLLSGVGIFICEKVVEQEEAVPKLAFGTMAVSENSDEKIMSVEEFSKKEIEYDIYRSDFHYSKLGEQEKLLYKCLEYALENGYSYIYVDDLIIPTADSFGNVLNFLALDSPLLEQNLIYETGTFTTYYDIGPMCTAKLDGIYLYVENINSALWKGKLEAIEKAKKIVEDMPDGLSETKKAEYLHRYTVENTKYHDYSSSDGVWQYLRDAVIDGKANCDGSANMLSLLLNIADIDCYEKMYTGKNIIGHTWNMIEIDGKWYNSDATAQKTDQSDNVKLYIERNFAFEDNLQRYRPDNSEIYPIVAEGLGGHINAHLESLDKTTFVKTINDAFAENGEKHAVLLIDNYEKSEAESAMQRLANSLGGTVSWYIYDVIEERTVMIVYV